jgi:hypothetical protein
MAGAQHVATAAYGCRATDDIILSATKPRHAAMTAL